MRPFADHTGKTAYMIFEKVETSALPLLGNFELYVLYVFQGIVCWGAPSGSKRREWGGMLDSKLENWGG